MNWQIGIIDAALFASLCGCCIQATLIHNWKLVNLFYWGSVLLIFVLASLFLEVSHYEALSSFV